MEDFVQLIQEWGPYIGLPLIIAFLTQALKKSIPFFLTVTGKRLIHFLPLVLGLIGGLLLPEDTWQAQILTGGGLGCVSMFLYKAVTVSLASKAKILESIKRDNIDLSEKDFQEME